MLILRRSFLLFLLVASITTAPAVSLPEFLTDVASVTPEGRSVLVTTVSGQRIRITPFGDYMVRVQPLRRGEDLFPDGRYEMVERFDWPGTFDISGSERGYLLTSHAQDGIQVSIRTNPARLSFGQQGGTLLQERNGVSWENGTISVDFVPDTSEHFTGLGHPFLGRSQSVDLRNQVVERNYGTQHGEQAPLIVPFLLSGRGYGVFLNSTFDNRFSLERDRYAIELQDHGYDGRMDYVVIAGPGFRDILDRYTQLTGRPRLPPLAVFGLGLSDKGNDEHSDAPSDEAWWKRKVAAHREAGFPIDHLINDNRWRACGGKRCESCLAWDPGRFPDPAEYRRWLDANGLITTLDFNRCIAAGSDGWQPSFNIPDTRGIEFGESVPDVSRPEVRHWWWNLFWQKSLDPALGFPGDALWIDEFDELGKADGAMILGNGRRWAEMRNAWFLLIAKALVQEGWDRSADSVHRPFVWVRGMTAGAQRYATLWSGDILPRYDDMKAQVRSMQLAGLSGFPFWGHDAGGFYDGEKGTGPDEQMYGRWSMAMGSFSPFWRPHGVGQSRWPLDRSASSQQAAKRYGDLRYRLMPYTYTVARAAHAKGLPMARAMVIDHQADPMAWMFDLEYMWGEGMLVAPNCSDEDSVDVWLPAGHWYDFWSDKRLPGNQVIRYPAPGSDMPLFVKAGAIIPMVPPCPGTVLMAHDTLIIHVYAGDDGEFTLCEDDGVSERFRTNGEERRTQVVFRQHDRTLEIGGATGTYTGASPSRANTVVFHGQDVPCRVNVDGKDWTGKDRVATDAGTGTIIVKLGRRLVTRGVRVTLVESP